jgi:hypothetical protein
MAIAIRIKLADLLEVMSRSNAEVLRNMPQKTEQTRFTGLCQKIGEDTLTDIQEYLQSTGPKKRRELEYKFSMSRNAVLRRLAVLKQRGTIVQLPENCYGPKEGPQ